jgi:hypothetical protein
VREEEYTSGKSIAEGNGSFGGRTARWPEVAVAMEREGGKKKEEEEQRTTRPKHYVP